MSTIAALLPFVGLVSPIAFGVASDALGLRSSLLFFANVGALVPFLALSVALLAGAHVAYPALFAAVGMFALFRTPMVLLADVTALEFPSSYGETRLWGSLGFMLMAVFAGRFIDVSHAPALPVTIAVGLSAAVLASALLRTNRARAPEPVLENVGRPLRNTDFRFFLSATFLWGMGNATYDLCYSLHLRDLSAAPGTIGEYWAVGVVAEIVLMGFSRRLFAAFTPSRLLSLGLLLAAVRWTLLSSVHSLAVLFVLQPMHAATFGLVWIAALAFVKERAPTHVLATAQSLFTVSSGIGAGCGMLGAGALYAVGKGPLVFGAAACATAIGTALSLAVTPIRANAETERQPS
jgi:PPP family 3-phenylpropionic acid transporter